MDPADWNGLDQFHIRILHCDSAPCLVRDFSGNLHGGTFIRQFQHDAAALPRECGGVYDVEDDRRRLLTHCGALVPNERCKVYEKQARVCPAVDKGTKDPQIAPLLGRPQQPGVMALH
jgi:hypothetical protein